MNVCYKISSFIIFRLLLYWKKNFIGRKPCNFKFLYYWLGNVNVNINGLSSTDVNRTVKKISVKFVLILKLEFNSFLES